MLKAVNVSTIPQRSPFRYPGGKTWLIPQIRSWLAVRGGLNTRLIEPFAGGAIVTLTSVIERLVNDAIIIELDSDVAAVWSAALGRSGPPLAKQVRSFDFTEKNVLSVLNNKPANLREYAFQIILKNRVTRNGILASGAGILKNGESGHGLKSRWYPDTLSKRLLKIHKYRSAITFKKCDGMRYLKKCGKERNYVYFIDPPYDGAGRRLYSHFDINHARLFNIAASLEGDFLMTYNKTTEIMELADKYGFETESIQMNGGSNGDKVELLVGRDLSWVSKAPPNELNTKNSEIPELCSVH